MHPTLMTIIADERARDLRGAARSRRGRVVRSTTRRFLILRRVAHA